MVIFLTFKEALFFCALVMFVFIVLMGAAAAEECQRPTFAEEDWANRIKNGDLSKAQAMPYFEPSAPLGSESPKLTRTFDSINKTWKLENKDYYQTGIPGGPPDPPSKFSPNMPKTYGRLTPLSYNFYFQTGNSTVESQHKNALNEVISAISSRHTNIVLVKGYSDSVGNKENNLILSIKRANAIGNELVSRGVDRNIICIYGFGEPEPHWPNQYSTMGGAIAVYRRVVIELW